MASKGHRVLAFATLAFAESEFPENFEFKNDPENYPNKGEMIRRIFQPQWKNSQRNMNYPHG
jgi:hypothetical protein